MDPVEEFESRLSPADCEIFTSLNTPYAIQAFLDSIPYSAEARDRCPKTVLQDRRAHCLDGGLFAAAALRRLGYPPLLVDMLPENDDDHVIAVFRQNGHLGALAKSNFTGLRYREPVYRSLRELIMSYFDVFFSFHGDKTLRGYTYPLNLSSLDDLEWMWSEDHIRQVVERMNAARKVFLLTPETRRDLHRVDRRTYDAGLLGADLDGIYVPK